MFYVLNDGKKEKKKNSDPYRKALKSLVKEIKDIDIDSLIRINNMGVINSISEIENFALWVKSQGDTINYKEVENRLRGFYKNSSIEELIYLYIAILSNLLYEDGIVRGAKLNNIPLNNIFADYEELNLRVKSRSIIASICIYAVILEEKLLDKRIDMIDVGEDYSGTRIIKEIKSENMSLFKGINGVPLLLTKKEAIFANQLVQRFNSPDTDIELFDHISMLYSYKFLEDLMAMYCFGKEVKDYINIKEFIGMEAIRVENARPYIIPLELLHKRKVLPPAGGVVLKLKNHKNIESVYIRECTRFNFRIIYGVVRYNDGFEKPISIRMNYYPTVNLYCVDSHDVTSVILDFYNIPKEELMGLDNLPQPAEYDILSPYYWRYRDKGYETSGERELRLLGKKVKREKTIKIATYVRKIKGNASEEARKLAEKVHIILGENQTLVREHDRVYNRAD